MVGSIKFHSGEFGFGVQSSPEKRHHDSKHRRTSSSHAKLSEQWLPGDKQQFPLTVCSMKMISA
jgi:hypothetical protein